MEIYLADEPTALYEKLKEHRREDRESGILCADTMRREARALRASIRERTGAGPDDERPLILGGHQPVFHHPGILIKDLLVQALARGAGGVACNLVVDTDEEQISFDYPALVAANGTEFPTAEKRSVVLNAAGRALYAQEFREERRRDFIEALHKQKADLAQIFPAARAAEIARELEALCDIVATSRTVVEPGVRFRETWQRGRGLDLHTLYASELTRGSAFQYFTDFIVERGDKFREVYNRALADYRREHRIRNTAQPLPDLNRDTKELPFWIIRDGNRIPFSEDTRGKDDLVFPRAVTLTLFVRLFLCDLFVHGRGGARYERITDAILNEFFGCKGAPYTVASATLRMPVREDIPLESRSEETIRRDIRALEFDPVRFLKSDHPLVAEHRRVVTERNAPDADKRAVHQRFMEIKRAARAELPNLPDQLRSELRRAAAVERNREVFFDRALPFIFYDTEALFEATRPYASAPAPASLAE